ncbi:putative vacuolar protein sorting-associated protein [Helianthus annuus]|uniref:Vacuolar protein sorting-associated protein n=1 Tax=Helianthus annuus TaxID=4232 RepID=A0A251TYL8_HELAN|nr:putative vacuolar protein sorting-associated protein [Helianthus annuus]KAJ0889895.1 putative vacuolar protein sorting-associated protein [Helianthus annuus]KAJ0894678.1 putative vacuolar protein sorting-associated protein [Helianthus annuus]
MRAKKMESITLFVASLNNRKRYSTNGKCDKRYLYFFDKGNTQITVASIHGPIELVITTEIQRDTATSDPTVDVFFFSTIRYIQSQKAKGGATAEKFEQIKVWFVFMGY